MALRRAGAWAIGNSDVALHVRSGRRARRSGLEYHCSYKMADMIHVGSSVDQIAYFLDSISYLCSRRCRMFQAIFVGIMGPFVAVEA